MAQKLVASDLMSLEHYARERPGYRSRMIGYRQSRQLKIGEHCTWSFEDRQTVQYQVQEMLRTERIFEAEGIAEELGAYNPLVPDGSNLKATLMIEYGDAAERAQRLVELRGIERRCWLRIGEAEAVFAIADEDLPRENEVKTSAVHFLRFEFSAAMIATLKHGAAISAGIDHPSYRFEVAPLPPGLHQALLSDFD